MNWQLTEHKDPDGWRAARGLVLVSQTTQGKIWGRMDTLPERMQWQRIVNAVAVSRSLPASSIAGAQRYKTVARARAECYWRIRHEVRMADGKPPSWSQIGAWMNRDHSTCIQMARKHAASQTRPG